jgi:hypothetical protein
MKLRRHENNVLAWKGDAALLYVARLVLTEIYPIKLPIKCLMERQERTVCNASLNAYCKRHWLKYGCNVMEIKIGEMVIGGQLEQAKEVVRDIIRNDKVIARMDEEQLVNGEVNEIFIKDHQRHEQIRLEKRRLFDKIKHSTLISPATKHRLIPRINKLINFLVTWKYNIFNAGMNVGENY